MIKKLISTLTAAVMCMSFVHTVSFAARPNVDENFENFAAESPWTAAAGSYAIKSEDSKYMAVPNTTAESSAPVLHVDYKGNMTLEFDAKTDSTCVMIYAKFEGEGYYSFFQTLVDGRGPLVRTSDSTPYFFFDTAATKPNYREWHNYRIDFDYSNQTIKTYVDGKENAKMYDRSYAVGTPTFPNKKLESLRFFVDVTKSGEACYDNIRLYTEDGGSDEIVFSDDYYKEAYLKLNALGIISDTVLEYPMDEVLTRGEFTELAMNMTGYSRISANEQIFADVATDHPQAEAINIAARMGCIAEEEIFRPDDAITFAEAAAIICNINNYSILAELNGGWPNGYVKMAQQFELTEQVNFVSGKQHMNMKDSVIMLANALTAPYIKMSFNAEGEAEYSENEDETILYRFYDLREVDCFIDKYDSESKQVTITTRKDAETYTASYTADNQDIENTMQYVWIDKENEYIKYMHPFRNSTVVYGYINNVNDSDDTRSYEADDIRRVSSTNCILTRLDSNAVITLNGELLTGAVSPVGMYSRIVVINDLISKIDLYDVESGGIIESASEDRIIYTNGVAGYSVMNDIDQEKPMKVILNNKLSKVKSLKADMYFDYIWIDSQLYVIASGTKVNGILTSISGEKMTINTEEGSHVFGVDGDNLYVSVDEGFDYSSDEPVSSFLNGNITVYVDANNVARYMKATDDGSFYGVVLRYNDECIDTEYPTLTLACIGSNNVTTKEYEVKLAKTTIYYPEVSYYDAAENSKKTDGSGIYKFTVKKGVIKKIEALDWYSEDPLAIGDEFFGGDDRLPRLKLDGSYHGISQNMIITLVNGRNEFEVSKVNWADIVGMATNSCRAIIEGTKPISNLTVLLDYNTVYFSTEFGFVQSVDEVLGEDDEIFLQYTISKRGAENTKTVPTYAPMVYGSSSTPVKKFDFIMYKGLVNKKYTSGSLQTANGNSTLDFQAINMSGAWEEVTKGIVSLKHLGTYKGIVNGYLKASLGGEENYMLLDASGYDIFEANRSHSRFSKASLGDIVGKDIWVVTMRDKTLAIFYEE